jgi:hypothetical protein
MGQGGFEMRTLLLIGFMGAIGWSGTARADAKIKGELTGVITCFSGLPGPLLGAAISFAFDGNEVLAMEADVPTKLNGVRVTSEMHRLGFMPNPPIVVESTLLQPITATLTKNSNGLDYTLSTTVNGFTEEVGTVQGFAATDQSLAPGSRVRLNHGPNAKSTCAASTPGNSHG